MKKGKWIAGLVALIVLVFVLVLAVKLVSGAFSVMHGALDTVLGIVLILALLILVAWMFLYAAKKRKK